MEAWFTLSNLLVLPFWFLMMFLPHWRGTKALMASPWVAAPPALLYLVLITPQLNGLLGSLANPSAAGIAQALSDPAAATLAWTHFLAFDLFVGRWAYLDSRARNLSPWIASPVLFFILMLGPIGFLLYLVARRVTAGPSRYGPQSK
jgi:hypothetical protein